MLTAELVDVASGGTRGSLREQAAAAEKVFALAGNVADSVRRTLGADASAQGFDLQGAEAKRRWDTIAEIRTHAGNDPNWRRQPSVLDQLRGWKRQPVSRKKASNNNSKVA